MDQTALAVVVRKGEAMGFKPFYKSKTVWGGVVTILACLSVVFGIDLNEEGGRLSHVAAGIIGALGGLIAVVGRFDANTKIIKSPKRSKLPLFLLCGVVVVGAGCSADPMTRWAQQRVVLSSIAR